LAGGSNQQKRIDFVFGKINPTYSASKNNLFGAGYKK
jgi:hypothetical protein